MKDFHNVFVYYGKSKLKEMNCLTNYTFFISYDVMLKYICAKKYTSQCTKKCKYIQEMIEIIFNIYETCDIY
jgi:hypothetical protein